MRCSPRMSEAPPCIQRARLTDIDDFIVACRQRYAPRTVADICSTLRCSSDSYARPAVPAMICPDRALAHYSSERATTSSSSMEGSAAHSEGRRSVKTHGRRDYAILLMMSVMARLG